MVWVPQGTHTIRRTPKLYSNLFFSPPEQEEGITGSLIVPPLKKEKKREEGDTACGLTIKKWFVRPHAVFHSH